jgi:suppressor for copper-sensitivity B
MLAASGWLFWVLIELNGSRALFPGWLAILFCCLSLWVWGKFFQIATVKIRTKVAFSPLLIISFLLCVFFFFTAVLSIKNNTNSNQSINEMVTNDESTYERNGINWIPWQEQLAKEYVENGFVVFIDFTASWCVICQTNKIRVLDTSPVIQVLSQPGIVTLRADWTNSDSKITQALFEYGRIGIPLNVVLGPNLSKPIVLSEWLTKSEVLDAILKAKN